MADYPEGYDDEVEAAVAEQETETGEATTVSEIGQAVPPTADALRARAQAMLADAARLERQEALDRHRARLARNLRMAEELGAEVVSLTAPDVPEGILRAARERRVSTIRSTRSPSGTSAPTAPSA